MNDQELNVDLSGKVALITGGSSGIGREIAMRYADHGARVVVADVQRTARDADTPTADAINAKHPERASFVECDVTDQGDIKRAIAAAASMGSIDVLVNNAGIFRQHDFLNLTPEDFDMLMNLNVRAVFFVAQAAAQQMVGQANGGSIINLSSVAGLQGVAGFTTYCASKGAVRLFTMALAQELAERNVRVNAIHPGLIRTTMTTDDVPIAEGEMGEAYASQIPMGRFGTPTDVAGIALFLASGLSRYVTGASMLVDGGMLRI